MTTNLYNWINNSCSQQWLHYDNDSDNDSAQLTCDNSSLYTVISSDSCPTISHSPPNLPLDWSMPPPPKCPSLWVANQDSNSSSNNWAITATAARQVDGSALGLESPQQSVQQQLLQQQLLQQQSLQQAQLSQHRQSQHQQKLNRISKQHQNHIMSEKHAGSNQAPDCCPKTPSQPAPCPPASSPVISPRLAPAPVITSAPSTAKPTSTASGCCSSCTNINKNYPASVGQCCSNGTKSSTPVSRSAQRRRTKPLPLLPDSEIAKTNQTPLSSSSSSLSSSPPLPLHNHTTNSPPPKSLPPPLQKSHPQLKSQTHATASATTTTTTTPVTTFSNYQWGKNIVIDSPSCHQTATKVPIALGKGKYLLVKARHHPTLSQLPIPPRSSSRKLLQIYSARPQSEYINLDDNSSSSSSSSCSSEQTSTLSSPAFSTGCSPLSVLTSPSSSPLSSSSKQNQLSFSTLQSPGTGFPVIKNQHPIDCEFANLSIDRSGSNCVRNTSYFEFPTQTDIVSTTSASSINSLSENMPGQSIEAIVQDFIEQDLSALDAFGLVSENGSSSLNQDNASQEKQFTLKNSHSYQQFDSQPSLACSSDSPSSSKLSQVTPSLNTSDRTEKTTDRISSDNGSITLESPLSPGTLDHNNNNISNDASNVSHNTSNSGNNFNNNSYDKTNNNKKVRKYPSSLNAGSPKSMRKSSGGVVDRFRSFGKRITSNSTSSPPSSSSMRSSSSRSVLMDLPDRGMTRTPTITMKFGTEQNS